MSPHRDSHERGSIGLEHPITARGATVSVKLVVSTVATIVFVFLELVVGAWANALALIGDALHNVTDSIALILALGVVFIEKRPPTLSKSFGYQRAGILAAFINAAALVGLTAFLFHEAWARFRNPEPVASTPMIIVAAIGIALNLAISLWLRRESRSDLNIRGAVAHLAGDTLSSAGVIMAAILISTTSMTIFDPIVSALIGLLILWSAWGILSETVNLLLEGTPAGIDPEQVTRDLAGERGVFGVHHLHIWAIAPSRPALSCHVMLGDVSLKSTGDLLHRINTMLSERYEIVHTTIQFEHAVCPDEDLCSPETVGQAAQLIEKP